MSNKKDGEKNNEKPIQDPFQNWRLSIVKHRNIQINNNSMGDSFGNMSNLNAVDEIQKLRCAVINLREQVESINSDLGVEFDTLEYSINKLDNTDSKEKIKAIYLFNIFIAEIENPNSTIGNTIKELKEGIPIIQQISKQYNEIAQLYGLPAVPKPFNIDEQ